MSNYDTAKRNAAAHFLTFDTEKIIKRLSLASDKDYLYLDFVSRPCRVNRKTGLCEYSDGGAGFLEADFNASLTIYDILCHTEEPIRLSGEFAPMESLSTVQNAASYAGEGAFWDSEAFFDRRNRALAAALVALGGEVMGKGDVSCRIPVFGEISVLFSFWNSDEDFPASLKIYCDKKLTAFMHYETLWYLASYLLEQIRVNMDTAE